MKIHDTDLKGFDDGMRKLFHRQHALAIWHKDVLVRNTAFRIMSILLPHGHELFSYFACNSNDPRIRIKALSKIDKSQQYLLAHIVNTDKDIQVRDKAASMLNTSLFPDLAKMIAGNKTFDLKTRFKAAKTIGLYKYPRLLKQIIFSNEMSIEDKTLCLEYLTDDHLNNIINGLLIRDLPFDFKRALIERMQLSFIEDQLLILKFLMQKLTVSDIRSLSGYDSRHRIILGQIVLNYPYTSTDTRCEEAVKKLKRHWTAKQWKKIFEHPNIRKRWELGRLAIRVMKPTIENMSLLYKLSRHKSTLYKLEIIDRLDASDYGEVEILKKLCLDKRSRVALKALEKIPSNINAHATYRKILQTHDYKMKHWDFRSKRIISIVLRRVKHYHFSNAELLELLVPNQNPDITAFVLKNIDLEFDECINAIFDNLKTDKFKVHHPQCYAAIIENIATYKYQIPEVLRPGEIHILIDALKHVLINAPKNDKWKEVKSDIIDLFKFFIHNSVL